LNVKDTVKRKRIEIGEVLAEAKNAIRRTQELLKESDKMFRWSRALHTESKQGRKTPHEFDEFGIEPPSS
jgi:hypothetical protein